MEPLRVTHTLKVALNYAKDLASSDYMFKSDPYVKFTLGNQSLRSSCVNSTLNPIWNPPEAFEFKVYNTSDQVLRVEVFDHDLITQDDLLGSTVIPVAAILKSTSEFNAFKLETPKDFASQQLNSLIFLRLNLIPTDEVEQVMELWENQHWSIGTGWCSEKVFLIAQRNHWSNENGSMGAGSFEAIAPKVPEGYEGSGWMFCRGKGDQEGWLYAASFAGPWYASSNPFTLVRRRRWINLCKPPKPVAQVNPRVLTRSESQKLSKEIPIAHISLDCESPRKRSKRDIMI